MEINTKRPFTVVVEGNIGSGKTTFLNHFQSYENVSVLTEPIDSWQNCSGSNLLGLLYEDSKRWSFTFQSYVLLTMFQQHFKTIPKTIKLMERSIYSVRYCFIDIMEKNDMMPKPSLSVLDEHFKWFSSKPESKIDLIVYLRTDPEIVYERIMRRNRNEETSISIDYVKKLHDAYEDWLVAEKSYPLPAPVLILNANLNKTEMMLKEYGKCKTIIPPAI